MAHDLQGNLLPVKHKDRKNVFELHSRAKLSDLAAGIRDPRLTAQMALFAHAVARAHGKLFRIQNVVAGWICQVPLYGSMTAVARNYFRREWLLFVTVEAACHMARLAGMAPQAFGCHWPREIRAAVAFVAWRHVP